MRDWLKIFGLSFFSDFNVVCSHKKTNGKIDYSEYLELSELKEIKDKHADDRAKSRQEYRYRQGITRLK